MRWTIVILIGTSLTFAGCGSDDDAGGGGGATQTESLTDESSDAGGSAQPSLAARLIEQSGVAGLGIDEECARENADELSDDDAQFLLDNYFVTIDLQTTSAEQQAWVDSIVDCLL